MLLFISSFPINKFNSLFFLVLFSEGIILFLFFNLELISGIIFNIFDKIKLLIIKFEKEKNMIYSVFMRFHNSGNFEQISKGCRP